jgi:hypothetical protein
MPKTTSRNWEAFNIEELDRRRRETEEKKLLPKPAGLRFAQRKRKTKKPAKQSGRRGQVTTDRKLHALQKPILSSNSRTGGQPSTARKVTVPTCVSLAKELETHLQTYILAAARSEGVDVKSVYRSIPISVANKIRTQVKAQLAIRK